MKELLKSALIHEIQDETNLALVRAFESCKPPGCKTDGGRRSGYGPSPYPTWGSLDCTGN